MNIKKKIFHFIILMTLLTHGTLAFSEAPLMSAEDAANESIKDIGMVMGMGTIGAILGLSTLSFVETPSQHLRNISVGGALGIFFGVGIVVFSQATKNTLASNLGFNEQPLNSKKYENLARTEFTNEKIAKNYLKSPDFAYQFSF